MPHHDLQPPAGTSPGSPQPPGLTDAAAAGLFALAAEAPREETDTTPPEIPGYTNLEWIGNGGMGSVYRAVQQSLGREVAVKVISQDLARDASFAARFEREARMLASLSHPHIVTIHDAGTTPDGRMFLTMEWISGTDLSKRLAETGALAPEVALPIVRQLCEALQAAHEVGVIHRDVKPSNILLDREHGVKLADFGIALPAGVATISLTLTGTSLGTPDYLSPESFRPGFQPDAQSDIFAAGVTLYQALTGEIPRGRFLPASKLVVGLDPRIDALIDTALHPDPARRYPSARAMAEAIAALDSPSASRFAKRLAVSIAACTVLAALAIGFGKSARHDSPQPVMAAANRPASAPAVIDVLSLVDLERDVLAGAWNRNAGGELIAKKGGFSTTGGRGMPRIQLPYIPPAEYDFEVEFTLAPGGDGEFFQLISVDGNAACWSPSACSNDPRFSGFARIDGLDLTRKKEGEIRANAKPRYGERNVSRVEVRQGVLRGFLNGSLLVEWKGEPSRLSARPYYPLMDARHLGLGVYRTDAVIHRAQVTEHGNGERPVHTTESSVYPPGRWIGPYQTARSLEAHGAAVTWKAGWITPGPAINHSICLDPIPPQTGSNWGVRATYRWSTSPGARAGIGLRKLIHRPAGQMISELYSFEVYSEDARFALMRSAYDGPAVTVPLGKSLSLDLRDGQEVTVEAYVIDGTLYGKVNGTRTETSTDGVLARGGFEVACYGMSFRNPEFINLDGLGKDEALKAAGLP